jgi:hypothetical protein
MGKSKTSPLEEVIERAKNRNEKVQLSDVDSQQVHSSSRKNLPRGWIRTTVVMREEHVSKLKDLAWLERSSQSRVLIEILDEYFSTKKVPIRPKKTSLFDD